MDRSSWQQQPKSPSPSGETDSSGSLSSHSDDQAMSKSPPQSPGVEALSERLSQALVNVSAKEDLVKQHARVAEEAVSGWERAENEVLALKKLNDALNHKNLVLDERVGQLDGALKECLRQLRQAREEHAKNNNEWESKTFELKTQLAELHSQLEIAKVDAINSSCSKLEAAEKETLILKLQLLSREQELDLSIHTAENANKLYLDTIKKVAKLEAECRILKAEARKGAIFSNNQSATESYTGSQSDNGERMLYIDNEFCKLSIPEQVDVELCNTNSDLRLMEVGTAKVPSIEIDLMDDFLEMERLVAACPYTGSHCKTEAFSAEKAMQCEMEPVIKGLEESLKCVVADKLSLKTSLDECQIQLKVSMEHLKRTEEKLIDMEKQLNLANQEKTEIAKELADSIVKLDNLTQLLDEAEMKSERLQYQCTETIASNILVETQLKDASKKKEEAEAHIKVLELDLIILKEEVERERKAFKQAAATCHILEGELSKLQSHSQSHASALMEDIGATHIQLEDANLKKVEAEKMVSEMGIKLQTLQCRIFKLEKELEKESQFSREAAAKCGNLEAEMSRMQQHSQSQKPFLKAEFRLNQEKELGVAASKFAECQKTIASLSCQLKSLAAFDDPLIYSEQPLEAVL